MPFWRNNRKVEKVAGMSSEEAKKILIQSMEADAKQDAAAIVRKLKTKPN